MDGPVGLDDVRVAFDDERAVSDAGIVLAATLAGRLGIEGLVDRVVRLRRERPGASNAGRKVMTLIYLRGSLSGGRPSRRATPRPRELPGHQG